MTIPFGNAPQGFYLGFGQGLRGLGNVVKLMDQGCEIVNFRVRKFPISPTGRRDRAGLHRSDRHGQAVNHPKFPRLPKDVERVRNTNLTPS